MSHTVKIQTSFTDLSALKDAIKSLGWSLIEKAKGRTYPGDSKANDIYDIVAVNPSKAGNAYDLGINVSDKGEISCHGDFYGGSLAAAFGEQLNGLKQTYAKCVFADEWESQGFAVTQTTDAQGNWYLDAVKS